MSSVDSMSRHAHWALRLAIVSVFLYHGLSKLFDLGGFAAMAGVRPTTALLVAQAEIAGAVLVFLGGFMRSWMTLVGALVIMPVMVGAILMVHWGQWHFMATETHPMGGMQFQVTLLLVLIYLALKGNAIQPGVDPDDRAREEETAHA